MRYVDGWQESCKLGVGRLYAKHTCCLRDDVNIYDPQPTVMALGSGAYDKDRGDFIEIGEIVAWFLHTCRLEWATPAKPSKRWAKHGQA